MTKYIETAKLIFKTQMAYRFDIITSIIFTVSKILLAYVLWGAVFEKHSVISRFTFNSMLSYYIISSFITQLDQSSGTGWQIAGEIKDGRFSKYITKPMSVFKYFAAHTAGVSAFLLSFNLIAAMMWILIFRIHFEFTGNIELIAAAFAMLLLGLLFMLQLNFFIGILAFKFLDIGIFMMIRDNILQFVTGSLIPLTILSPEIIRIMAFFPFYYVSYLPSMLLLGRNGSEIIQGFAILICWNIAFMILNLITYARLRTIYDGVGI